MTDLTALRFATHEEALHDLRRGAITEAARGMRRLLMLIPPDHVARRDVLYVLEWVERRARNAA